MNLNIEQKLTELVNDTMFHPPALCFEDILASVSMLNYGPVSLDEVYKRGFFKRKPQAAMAERWGKPSFVVLSG